MARPINSMFGKVPVMQVPPPEPIVPQQATFYVPPQGMDTQHRVDQLGRRLAVLVQNFVIRDDHYVARDGTALIGGQSGKRLLHALSVKLATGKTWVLRWTTGELEYLQSGVWTPANGDRWTTGETAQVSVTGWADQLIFTVGTGYLFAIDFSTNVPVVTEIATGPTDVGHVTTFARRIIASIRNSSEVDWCVANDYTDWSGLGSGFEDLKAAPGRSVDQQTAVVPVTDEYAYCIRTNSVWQMTLTGDFDAPFRFSQLYSGVGSEYPGSVVQLRQGVAMITRDNIVAITPQGMQEIGNPIREEVRVDKKYLRDASADYDPRDNELLFSIPNANSLGAHPVYRYKPMVEEGSGGWVKDVYPFPVKSLSFTRYAQSTTIDDLQGTIDQLEGAIDDLGISDRSVGLLFALSGSSRRVVRSTSTTNNNTNKDVNSAGVAVPGGWRIESGYILVGPTVNKVVLVEVQIEYEAEDDADLTFEYSTDGGVTWIQYDARTAPATDRPRLLRVRQTLEREAIQIAINCEQSPGFRLLAMHAYASIGGVIEDAR